MDPSNHGNINIFDEIRLMHGIDKLKIYFLDLVNANREKAIHFINDDYLHFCSLYMLQSEIKENKLYGNLNSRNKSALNIINDISIRKSKLIRNSAVHYTQMSHSSMKWILETGSMDDGNSNQFDAILDSAAALLIKSFNDKSVLPIVANMIFDRHRKGLFNYDLVWVFFEARAPYSLALLASRLCSQNPRDVELARKLLSFIPYTNIGVVLDSSRLHILCKAWLQQNLSYLHYTGDSFQQTCNPIRYVVSWEAKYLCKAISADTGKFLAPLTIEEEKLLKCFRALSYNSRVLLADYSFKLNQQDGNLWNTWLRYPVTGQIKIADAMGGRLL